MYYIYDSDTSEVVAAIDGNYEYAEKIYDKHYSANDGENYGLTGSPAFGCRDGLIDRSDAKYYRQPGF